MVLKNKYLLLCMPLIIASMHGSEKQPIPRTSLWKIALYGLLLMSPSTAALSSNQVIIACAEICHNQKHQIRLTAAHPYLPNTILETSTERCILSCYEDWRWITGIGQCWHLKNTSSYVKTTANRRWEWDFTGETSLLSLWSKFYHAYLIQGKPLATLLSVEDCLQRKTSYNSSDTVPDWAYSIFEETLKGKDHARITSLCISTKSVYDASRYDEDNEL